LLIPKLASLREAALRDFGIALLAPGLELAGEFPLAFAAAQTLAPSPAW